MQLVVVSSNPVVVGHRLRLPGEVLEVTPQQGRAWLEQHGEALEEVRGAAGQVATPEAVAAEADSVPLEDLELSTRTLTALEAAGIADAAALAALDDAALLELAGIGQKALGEIKAALDAVALT